MVGGLFICLLEGLTNCTCFPELFLKHTKKRIEPVHKEFPDNRLYAFSINEISNKFPRMNASGYIKS